MVAAALKSGAAILTAPVIATVKQVTDGEVTGTIDRDLLRMALTPQVARLDWLLSASTQSSVSATDESQGLERAGRPVTAVAGDATNVKITTTSDLIVAEALLAARHRAIR